MSTQANSNKRQAKGKIAAILGIALIVWGIVSILCAVTAFYDASLSLPGIVETLLDDLFPVLCFGGPPAEVLGGVMLLWAAGRWQNKAWQRLIRTGLIVGIVALVVGPPMGNLLDLADASSEDMGLDGVIVALAVSQVFFLFVAGCGIAGFLNVDISGIARFFKPTGTPSLVSMKNQGDMHLLTHDLSAARACYQEALRLALELSQAALAAEVICRLAEVELAQGRVEPALAALAWVQAQAGVDQQTRSRAARLIEGAAGRLSPGLAEQALGRGRLLPLEEVAASFLED